MWMSTGRAPGAPGFPVPPGPPGSRARPGRLACLNRRSRSWSGPARGALVPIR